MFTVAIEDLASCIPSCHMETPHIYYQPNVQKAFTSCVYALTGIPKALPSPKSASLMAPFASMRRFWGFRSR